jgi:hypothetical protein
VDLEEVSELSSVKRKRPIAYDGIPRITLALDAWTSGQLPVEHTIGVPGEAP